MKYGQKVMSVRDLTSNSFAAPFLAPTVSAAIRSFGDAVNQNDKDNAWFNHPECFELCELGEFDVVTGLFETGVPRQVALARDLKRVQQ